MAPIKHNLVALGTAAVLAVYAAGYSRTRAAAQAFADEGVRRPARPAPGDAVVPPAVTPSPPTASPATRVDSAPSTPASAPRAKVQSAPKPRTQKAVTKAPASTDSTPVLPTTPVPPPVVTAAVPSTPTPPAKDSATKPAAQTTDSAKAADKAPAPFKDGMYTGWGTSRHGDIQATVMIKEGKIVGAVISECLTQYSCSWIAALPQQVLDRQSAEVDYVSGATQSANAFYYAVVNALKKAK